MPRKAGFDRAALEATLAAQHALITRSQAFAIGMTDRVVQHRIRPGGPWQLVLPGVYLAHPGTPSGDQRDMAALLYTGPDSVLTGAAALRRHRLRNVQVSAVDVLVPTGIQRRDASFVRIHRTDRMPGRHCYEDGFRYALPQRAVADAARALSGLAEVRAVVADAVQQGICPVSLVAAELAAGPVRGSALLRQAVDEVADGVRSTAEADLHRLITRSRLPAPMFNPRLFVGADFLAVPDCWWPGSGVAVEVDSRAWHFSPADWEKTLARHARMSAEGILVLHFTPRQIRVSPRDVVTAIRRALAAGRPLPRIRTVPAA